MAILYADDETEKLYPHLFRIYHESARGQDVLLFGIGLPVETTGCIYYINCNQQCLDHARMVDLDLPRILLGCTHTHTKPTTVTVCAKFGQCI